DDVLKIYQINVLPGEKLVFNSVNMLNSMDSNIRKMKKAEVSK
ncbi:17180_t:CDS:1, partial [Funneliformis caledonium]